MIIFGTILAIILAIVLSLLLGPFGGLVLLSILFGLVLNIYQTNRRISEDLQRIKEKLGIEDKDDFHLSDEEIEKELEKEQLNEDESSELAAVNEEIEKELEEYQKKKGNTDEL